jgi:endogenous inhibitor of DNA gyrase (YacG/DUF329 family)
MKKLRCPICERSMAVPAASPASLRRKSAPAVPATLATLATPATPATPSKADTPWPHWPFCSRRCQLIDLGRWLGGEYRIAAPVSDESGDSHADDSDDSNDASKPAVPSADSHSHEAP